MLDTAVRADFQACYGGDLDLDRDGDLSRGGGDRLLDLDLLAARFADPLRLRDRLLLLLRERDRERERGGPGESSISFIFLSKNSVLSNFSMAFFIVLYDWNSTTPSPTFS